METHHRDKLRSNRIYLLENVDYKKIRDLLLQEGIVDEDRDEAIMHRETRKDKMRKLLDEIPRMGEKAYPVLIKSIKAVGKNYHHILKQLDEFTEVVDEEELPSSDSPHSNSGLSGANSFMDELEKKYPKCGNIVLNHEDDGVLIGLLSASEIPEIKTLGLCLGISLPKLNQIQIQSQNSIQNQIAELIGYWIETKSKKAKLKTLVAAYVKAKLPESVYEKEIKDYLHIRYDNNDRDDTSGEEDEREEEQTLQTSNTAADKHMVSRLEVVEHKVDTLMSDKEKASAPLDPNQITSPALQALYQDLVDHMHSGDILPVLFSKIIISIDEKERIDAERIETNKNRMILYAVDKQGKEGIEGLIDSLASVRQQKYLSVMLKKEFESQNVS